MKTILAAVLAVGLLAGQASARTIFDDVRDSAPRSEIFSDIGNSAPRSAFDELRDSAPRSDGVFGTLEQSAP